MAREKSQFVCQKCGYISIVQMGRCPNCGEWNSLVEETKNENGKTKNGREGAVKILRISEVKRSRLERIKTGIGELDSVLGGGLVAGSVVLMAGEPGIGKSTLLSQLLVNLGGVYVSGEESPQQVKMRIERLKATGGKTGKDFYILPETQVERVIGEVSRVGEVARGGEDKVSRVARVSDTRGTLTTRDTFLIVVDSIQTMTTEALTGTAGSVGQVRESANKFLKLAKREGWPLFLIGHVTKEGAIAGPRVLEHLVDTVLYLEGDRQHDLRLLRVVKNRFGPTDEVGVLQMTGTGILEVKDPTGIFLKEKVKNVAGSVVVPTLEGNRVLLVEIQALATTASLKYPKRLASGVDQRKLELLCAVIQRQLHLPLYKYDVFVNVAGGVTIDEPGVGLGICLAIASSIKNLAMPARSGAIGEVGLLGEVRPVFQLEKRVKEARKMGFTNLVTPKDCRSLVEAVRKIWGK